jgi:hypothetical protein
MLQTLTPPPIASFVLAVLLKNNQNRIMVWKNSRQNRNCCTWKKIAPLSVPQSPIQPLLSEGIVGMLITPSKSWSNVARPDHSNHTPPKFPESLSFEIHVWEPPHSSLLAPEFHKNPRHNTTTKYGWFLSVLGKTKIMVILIVLSNNYCVHALKLKIIIIIIILGG